MKPFFKTSLFSFLRAAVLAAGLATLALAASADAKEDIKADMVAGRWPQAETRLVEVLNKHPDNALAHYWYAQVLEKEGKTAAAATSLAKALQLAPDEKFAGNKEQLARMMKRLHMSRPDSALADATRTAEAPGPETRLQVPESPAVVVPAPPAPERASGGMSMLTWIFIGAGVLLVLLVFVSRRSGSAGLKQQRDRWTAGLNDAMKDLADAQLVSDSNPALSEAQRLGNYDRIRLIKGDLSSHLASMPTRSDFSSTEALILRARDIAADLRGEERPSERLHRENQDKLDREAAMASAQGQGQGPYGPGYAQQPGRGGGLLRDAALLGGGALLGSMLSGGASARERQPDHGGFGGGSGSLHEADGGGVDNSVDVGGSDAGSDFDFGSSSDSGGGSDDFN